MVVSDLEVGEGCETNVGHIYGVGSKVFVAIFAHKRPFCRPFTSLEAKRTSEGNGCFLENIEILYKALTQRINSRN